jgi:hypothetical protein
LLKSNKFGGNEFYMEADKAFIAQMDKRFKELETGKVKRLTMEALAARARLVNKKSPLSIRGCGKLNSQVICFSQ